MFLKKYCFIYLAFILQTIFETHAKILCKMKLLTGIKDALELFRSLFVIKYDVFKNTEIFLNRNNVPFLNENICIVKIYFCKKYIVCYVLIILL